MKVASRLNWIKLESGKASSGGACPTAFTLTELMVVLAVVSLFAVMLLHTQAGTRADVQRIQCVSNLKQVGLAFRLWAANHNDEFPMAVGTSGGGTKPASGPMVNGADTFKVFLVMSNELITPKVAVCPTDSDMRPPATTFIPLYAEFTDNARVSYFVGRDADQLLPRMLLSGDRNIYGPLSRITDNGGYGNSGGPGNYAGAAVPMTTSLVASVGWTEKLHQKVGNICLADGSVQQVTTSRLTDALLASGDTNSPANSNFILYP